MIFYDIACEIGYILGYFLSFNHIVSGVYIIII